MGNNAKKEIKDTENLINLEVKKTNLKKLAFIEEIKNGLGDEIKENPNRVEFTPRKKDNRAKLFFKKIIKLF